MLTVWLAALVMLASGATALVPPPANSKCAEAAAVRRRSGGVLASSALPASTDCCSVSASYAAAYCRLVPGDVYSYFSFDMPAGNATTLATFGLRNNTETPMRVYASARVNVTVQDPAKQLALSQPVVDSPEVDDGDSLAALLLNEIVAVPNSESMLHMAAGRPDAQNKGVDADFAVVAAQPVQVRLLDGAPMTPDIEVPFLNGSYAFLLLPPDVPTDEQVVVTVFNRTTRVEDAIFDIHSRVDALPTALWAQASSSPQQVAGCTTLKTPVSDAAPGTPGAGLYVAVACVGVSDADGLDACKFRARVENATTALGHIGALAVARCGQGRVQVQHQLVRPLVLGRMFARGQVQRARRL